MATDLFGKPIGDGSQPEFKLNLQQKRQATLLYYWMSLDYLKGLKDLIDALINGVDVNLELAKRQGRDALLTNERWGVRDTAANWSTHVFPALEDFRKATIKDIALRAAESYEFTGANQCGRMIDEFSSMWMTHEEEEAFKKQFEAVYRYAEFIDFAAGVGGRRNQLDDESMARMYWPEHAHLFPRLPKFRVRTDIEAVTDKRPVRTGVYVPQDDPFGALQFAWTGNNDGSLGAAETLNDFGRRVAAAIGRDALWLDENKMAAFATDAVSRGELAVHSPLKAGDERNPDDAIWIVSRASFTTRPCKWYFVEKVEGEFDDEGSVTPQAAPPVRLRVEAGQDCPREGFWFTPARANSRRHFNVGERMPAADGAYGTTIWQWDENQS